MNHALILGISNFFNKRQLGPHRIATHLRQEGMDVEVIDWANFFSLEELREIIKSRITSKTVFVGFSSFMSYWDKNLDLICKWIYETYPHVAIIYGGQSPPRVKTRYIHYYIYGYGEIAAIELTKSLTGNTPSGGIKFDLSHKDKKVINAIHSYPAFPKKDLKTVYQNRDFIHEREWLTLEFSRGCIFKCLYCNYPILGVKGDYTRSAEDFYEEMIGNYDSWGITNYIVADETFNDYTEKVIKYANVAERLPFDPWFSGFLRGDLLASRPQDWEHMARLGMLGHFYGLESLNPASAKAIGKGGNMDKILNGILDAKKYFLSHGQKRYRGQISLIAGLPYETFETLDNTKKWLEENWHNEFTNMYPLEIPVDPKVDRLSKLSDSYVKWGYEKLDDGQIDKYGIDQIEKKMTWKNEHMDLYSAKEYTDNFKFWVQEKDYFGLSVFNLHFPYHTGKSLDECLKLLFNNTNYYPDDTIFYDRLMNYKHKKLSL